MQRGRLPVAPIVADIRTFSNVPRADVVAAGFPCIGFSAAGKRRGFADSQTRLFFDMLRVIDAARPRLLFLENVPGVMRSSKLIVRELVRDRKYNMRWCMACASDLGAPHRRKRWFCVAYKHERDLPEALEFEATRKTAWRTEPKERMSRRVSAKRLRLLGNALVPQVARAAYAYLCDVMPGPITRSTTAAAVLSGDHRTRYHVPDFPSVVQTSKWGIVLRPGAFASHKRPPTTMKHSVTSTIIHRRMWATPLAQTVHSVNHLTERSADMLPTQVRFEMRTPNSQRDGMLSATFVEWMMGFPMRWTATRPCGKP